MLMLYLAMIKENSDKLPFVKIYAKYSHDIYKRVYKILGNKYDTDDVTQDIWTIVCRNMDFYRDRSDEQAKAYIIGIAKNQAYMFLRKKRRTEYIICDVDTFANDDNAEELIMFKMCSDNSEGEIIKCIEELGEPYNDVLMYYYVYEHTIKQIAQIMGEKESTVGSRLTRGRKKLIQLLMRRGYRD